MSPFSALTSLWRTADLPPEALAYAQLTGNEPVLPSSFAIGTAAQASIAASGLAAAALWQQRGGGWQQVSVEMQHAAIEFRSERHVLVDGVTPPDPWDKIAGLYRCADGWVRIHTNFPHHRDGILALLNCEYDKESVQSALLDWQAVAFETAASERGLVATALRNFDEWDQHPQAVALRNMPLFTIEKMGDAPPQPLPPSSRPLEGVRVLDLTRIIAGPVCGRTLAAHGADVLLVTSPKLPSIPTLVVDTGRGKRACHIDLQTQAGRDTLGQLLRDTDIMVQGYRPGGLNALGFGPEALATAKPGIIYVSLSAYGHEGPWANRRGFDSLTQTATGLNVAEAQAAGQVTPRALPAQAIDHASGYLMALGAMAALYRRATEGGSWHVRVSLAQTGLWLRNLGRVPDGIHLPEPTEGIIKRYLEQSESGFGMLTSVRHAALLSQTPAKWARPSVPLGQDAARWN